MNDHELNQQIGNVNCIVRPTSFTKLYLNTLLSAMGITPANLNQTGFPVITCTVSNYK